MACIAVLYHRRYLLCASLPPLSKPFHCSLGIGKPSQGSDMPSAVAGADEDCPSQVSNYLFALIINIRQGPSHYIIKQIAIYTKCSTYFTTHFINECFSHLKKKQLEIFPHPRIKSVSKDARMAVELLCFFLDSSPIKKLVFFLFAIVDTQKQ